MNKTDVMVETTLRIPGTWHDGAELMARLPEGFRINSRALVLPDGTEIEFAPLPPDDQFAKIFQSVCRQPPTAEEMRRVNGYTVNIGLIGPGGSMAAALTTMQAGAAIVRAGGVGVLIDNSALAHGGEDWIKMAEDGSSDATSFAFVNIVRGKQDVRTVGMRAMGLPDIVMQLTDTDTDDEVIIDAVRSMCRSEKPIGDGHLLGLQAGPHRLIRATDCDPCESMSAMHNPFGRLQLLRSSDGAQQT